MTLEDESTNTSLASPYPNLEMSSPKASHMPSGTFFLDEPNPSSGDFLLSPRRMSDGEDEEEDEAMILEASEEKFPPEPSYLFFNILYPCVLL